MDSIIEIINLHAKDYNIGRSDITNVQGMVNIEMKPTSWILLELSNRLCATLRWDHGSYMNEGYLMNDEKILRVFADDEINGELEFIEDKIIDAEDGSRYEGKVLRNSDVPFGFGAIYDNEGVLVYKGIVVNGKRTGFGRSFQSNGVTEYEGYWCDDHKLGTGDVYNRRKIKIESGVWCNDQLINEEYEGFGCILNVGLKNLKLFNKCVLKDWDVSLFWNLESIEIRDECFSEVRVFRIDGLNRLKKLTIGKNSFSQKTRISEIDETKSFHIVDCKQLESIVISRQSFFDFSGEFELKNLPSLKSLEIGTVGRDSMNFFWSSFVIRSS